MQFKTADKLLAVNTEYLKPEEFDVSQNYPNPINPTTTIQYKIPKRSIVKVEVYDALGRVVDAISEGTKDPGKYQTTFNLNNKASGMYVYKVTAGEYTAVKRMILMK